MGSKKILVTGGAGYIGSHSLVDLIQNGFEVVSIDNFSNSRPEALEGVRQITGKTIQNYPVDLTDLKAVQEVFKNNPDLSGVIHFAAHILVGESVDQPLKYFHNNLLSLLNVIRCMQDFKVPHLIFSSSCSVYGNATDLPVTEETPFKEAESPYARTKQMGEQILQDITSSPLEKNFQVVLLRYFNPAGAHPSGLIGEAPLHPSTHLVPVIMQTAVGSRDKMMVFGGDYPTRDGSCVRDYIHIMDLANAHTRAIKFLIERKNDSQCEVFNLGIGEGVTVLEAINAYEKVTGNSINYAIGPRREGDVVAIYANRDKAEATLGWQPKYTIEDIMETAWKWEQALKIRK